MGKHISIDDNTLDAYLSASAKLTEIAHGTNLSIECCNGPNSFVVSDKFAPDFKIKIEFDLSSDMPITLSTDKVSKKCKDSQEAQQYILRSVMEYRVHTA